MHKSETIFSEDTNFSFFIVDYIADNLFPNVDLSK